MSDTPGVPQPVFSKATHVPPPVAHSPTTLNGGRGAPAPNGVGRGFGRGDRGESIAGRGCVRNESHERRLRLAESADEHRRRAALPPFPDCFAPRGDPRGEPPSSGPLRTRTRVLTLPAPRFTHSQTRRTRPDLRRPRSRRHARSRCVDCPDSPCDKTQTPNTRRGFGRTNASVEAAPTRRATDSSGSDAATDTVKPESSSPAPDENRRSRYHEPQQRRAPSEGPASYQPAARRWGRQGAAVHVRHVQP
jgi:hypothetical protein